MATLLTVLVVLLVLCVAALSVLLRRRMPVSEDIARKAADQTVAETLRRLDGLP